VPSGVVRGTELGPFDPAAIGEHVARSWYRGECPLHPSEGETRPYATGQEGERYSWLKAPRLGGEPAETGPLAEALVSGNRLFADLVATGGPSALVRQLARLVRPAEMIPAMETWLSETDPQGAHYTPRGEIVEGEAAGLTHASRGALGHWVRVKDGAIEHYQIITPTGWNLSPRDTAGTPGPLEQALVGTPVRDPADPVEIGSVVRSFDPCLVCAVHLVERGRTIGRQGVVTW
jgi:hydrogenase large subunit